MGAGGGGSGLGQPGDFRRLWVGQTISVFGSQFSALALPVVAVLALGATPAQVGILAAAETAPFLLFGLLVGVWVDRHRRRATMILADVGRGTVLGVVAGAALLGLLTLEFLYLSGFLVGLLTVFFDVAYQAYLPLLVERPQLVEANGKLEASRAASQVAGPGLAGATIQFASAALAIGLDALSYLASALFLWSIGKPEVRPERASRGSVGAEVREGLTVVFGDARLRSIAGCTATANFFGAAIGALYVLFALRELGLRPVDLGLIFSVGSVGGLAGAIVAGRVARRIGIGPAIVLGAALAGVATVPLALATPALAYPLLITSQVVTGIGVLVYNVNQVSLRQAITAHPLLGRMNATMRFLVWGTLPLGGIAGGLLGEALGLRGAIALAVAGGLAPFLWVYFSPVLALERIPETPPAAPPIAALAGGELAEGRDP